MTAALEVAAMLTRVDDDCAEEDDGAAAAVAADTEVLDQISVPVEHVCCCGCCCCCCNCLALPIKLASLLLLLLLLLPSDETVDDDTLPLLDSDKPF